VCHHISNAVYFCTDFYTYSQGEALGTAWLLSVSSWLLPGYFLVISQLLPGSYLVTARLLHSHLLVTSWLLLGYCPVTT